ncbi:MAG: MGH1-like glycoside hydrolase domain-containing protein, partial [Longimicrobiales bacterium]
MAPIIAHSGSSSGFYLQEAYNRPATKYAWSGPSVLIVDNAGACGAEGLQGFFFRQIRFLRDLRLEIRGESPFLCSIGRSAPSRIEVSYVYPEPPPGAGQEGIDMQDGMLFRNLDIDLRYEVHPASVEAVLRIGSHWQAAAFDLAWVLSADYVDPDAARRGDPQEEARVESHPANNGVRFSFAHEATPLATQVSVEGGGAWSFSDGRLATQLRMERQETVQIRLHIRALDSEDPIDAAGEQIREEHVRRWLERRTRIHAPGETPLADITNLATHDLGSLALLEGPEEEWLSPAAGIPIFPSLWGRDALTVTWQASVFDRGDMAAAVLAKLARTQGTVVDDALDEQPGRIVRHIQSNVAARVGRGHRLYYGDFSSPFMFILALGNAYAWSGDRSLLERHWDAAQRVLAWARDYGDMDGDGYLEYQTRSQDGPRHQGWKDSDNAVVDADGSQVDSPIAPCEIQGYWFAALQFMAIFAVILGERAHGLDLWRQASELKARFNRDFWMDDEGIVGFGLDPRKRLIRSITSNAGQCLTTGIIEKERLPRVVKRLFEPDMFSGWGIRTLSLRNPAYHPLSYHLGSVWPVENATILFGLRRFGFDDRTQQLARALYDLARIWSDSRSPECVGGYARDERPDPGAYPQANAPQAWNQSALPILVQTLLGLQPVAALRLLAVAPALPRWLPEITVKHLRVGDATVTLRFWRGPDGASRHEIVEQEGTLRIVRQPPLDALNVGIVD